MTHKSSEERSRTMSWKSWTMPSILFQREKKTRSDVCYDGLDIPDDNTRRNRGTGHRKRNQAPTGQNNTVR